MPKPQTVSLFGMAALAGVFFVVGCDASRRSEAKSMPESLIPDSRLEITHGNFSLELAPQNGGSISSFKYHGQDIMRPAPDTRHDVADSAYFPLVPIVNRIPNGQFVFDGVDVSLEGNFLGLPDFIHGHGWRGEWRVDSRSRAAVTLSYHHNADAWPWAYQAVQVFELRESGLRVDLSVTNQSNKPMPAALGFHPYFPTTPETRLKANYKGHWINNDLGHVKYRTEGSYRKDFTRGADLIDKVMTDQTHFGWSGPAVLTEPGRPPISITAPPDITNLHVFFPPNGNYVAIEPTAGRGDPFGTDPVEYKVIEPGETFSIWMQVDVD